MAQRMESVAPPGGVMLSASTARLVDRRGARRAELVQIKGADEPVPAHRLLGVPSAGRRPSRLESGRAPVGAGCLEGLLDRSIAG